MKKYITGKQANIILGFDIFIESAKICLECLDNGYIRLNNLYRLSEYQKDNMKKLNISFS